MIIPCGFLLGISQPLPPACSPAEQRATKKVFRLTLIWVSIISESSEMQSVLSRLEGLQKIYYYMLYKKQNAIRLLSSNYYKSL